MHLRHSSKLAKGSNKSPRKKNSPDEDGIKHKVVEKKPRTGMRRTKSSNGVVHAKERHLISSPHETDGVVEEEILDQGLDEWDDDCASVSSSISSGPSLYYPARLSQDLCSACQKLYQKARRMKAPLKNKLLDNDPKSLTCDQWVLIKNRRLARMSDAGGKLLISLQRVKKRLRGKKVKQHEQPPACSRPHIYLERNLRRRVPLKKERKTNKRRKRTRDDSQGSRVAKQQRLQSNVRGQHISSVNDSCYSASTQNDMNELEDYSDQDTSSAGPSSVINPTTTELPSKQTKSQTFQRGFRELLLQLRGNSSNIVREPH
ncbi:uncharacterized protein si:ch211-227n13.3 isoform X2 [Betta splendens]|nr:uncharacterized protein si:ch211-227n13.3 isoform X2 [Betta splendens]